MDQLCHSCPRLTFVRGMVCPSLSTIDTSQLSLAWLPPRRLSFPVEMINCSELTGLPISFGSTGLLKSCLSASPLKTINGFPDTSNQYVPLVAGPARSVTGTQAFSDLDQ